MMEMKVSSDKQNTEQRYIWYACYGSNINKERFLRYIEQCEDKSEPKEERCYEFPHNIYFAAQSKAWENGAVAFLDDMTPGHAYGKIYKITKEQFDTVKHKEGKNYTKQLTFDEVDGLPVYSFTCEKKFNETNRPSVRYYETIFEGLKALYTDLGEDELKKYLDEKIV